MYMVNKFSLSLSTVLRQSIQNNRKVETFRHVPKGSLALTGGFNSAGCSLGPAALCANTRK